MNVTKINLILENEIRRNGQMSLEMISKSFIIFITLKL